MDKDNYIVTVVVPVYNHERYIEQAIMSIYNQKTDYKYKVLIGEDKSTDNSREILKKLQKKLPENFIFLYREQNMGIQNFYDMYERITTKYYIMLEGSDEIFDVSVVDFIDIIRFNVGDEVTVEYKKGEQVDTVLSLNGKASEQISTKAAKEEQAEDTAGGSAQTE